VSRKNGLVRVGIPAMAIVVLSGLFAAPPAYADSTTVTFDVFGSPAISPIPIIIWGAASGSDRANNATLPWSQSVTVETAVDAVMLSAQGPKIPGSGAPGCRIMVGHNVVAQQQPGGSGRCAWAR
jgi:hypothetical protein